MDRSLYLSTSKLTVSVETRARLHLGFLDMSGTLGRRFGSLGLAISGYRTKVLAQAGNGFDTTGAEASRAAEYAMRFLDHHGLPHNVNVHIEEAIPEHLGLGSGTQLALAVGTAIARLHDIDVNTRSIANLLDRGARSGIGITSFDQGGFIVDSGRGEKDEVPPVVSRMALPAEWRVLLVLDNRGQGLHGKQEISAFRKLPPFPEQLAAHLCHLALMQILPAAAEGAFDLFSEGVAEIQRVVGDHFAPVQGGRFTSPPVASALAWATSRGYPGVGQSSWGPTGFIFVPDQCQAERLASDAVQHFGLLSQLQFKIAESFNQGSIISTEVYAPRIQRTF